MKRIYSLLFLVTVAFNFSLAQTISIVEAPKLWFEFETPLTLPKISPDGKYIAFSEDNLRDLYLSPIDSIVFERVVKSKSAGWQFRWSPNSNYLITSAKPMDFNSPYDDTYFYLVGMNGKVDTILKSVDEAGLPAFDKSGERIYFVVDGKTAKHLSLTASSSETPFAIFSNEKLFVGGIESERINFIPEIFENRVILFTEWSPDFSKLAVQYVGLGIVVYDLNTKKSYQFQHSEYPSWLNNEYLVFMKVADDGYKFIDADAYCAKFDNTNFANLSANFPGMVFYPWASADGTIAFVDQLGKIYKMKIKVE